MLCISNTGDYERVQENTVHLMEAECAEVREDLQLSRRRVEDLQKSLVTSNSSSSNQPSLDYSDSELDDDTFVFLIAARES